MLKNYTLENCSFDKYQLDILNCHENMLIIAGAGAGKTLTILGKINYLIENNECLLSEILVISFTNASVNDLKMRIKYDVSVSTFHKLAINILDKLNINYKLCNQNLLNYIINEYLNTCSLKEQQIIIKYLKLNIKYSNFLNSKKYDSFINFILTVINILKTNNIINQNILNSKLNKLDKEILLIIFKIYQKYLDEKNSTNTLDFDDLIIYATKYVNKVNLNYKYIIIDEFQDTSLIRLNLIREIYKYTNSKIIVVGDDYQSIYRFSGCDLNIFLNFNKYFPNVSTIKLVNTYRNSNELINIASTFINKNPLQIKKELHSNKSNPNPLIFVPTLNNEIKMLKKLLDYLFTITNDIMIISRNYKDIYSYIDKDFILNNDLLTYKDNIIKYYTIHKSKGLQGEFVIILNCNNSYLGLPNKIENNHLIEKILPNNEMKYAEERRLFYVGITRCINSTYLFYNKNNPSKFIKEIKKIVKKNLNNIKYFK